MTPEKPVAGLQSTLYSKVILAVISGREPHEVLDAQRSSHLKIMRELTRHKTRSEPAEQLGYDYSLFHLEADLRWLELAVRVSTVLSRRLGDDGVFEEPTTGHGGCVRRQ